MRTFLLLVFLLFTSAGCCVPRTVPAENGQCFEEKKFEAAALENRYLALEFLPESMGRISSIRYRPSGKELLSPYKAVILRGNPLKVKFDRQVSEMVDTVIGNGIEHHYVVVHGDITDKLKQFAEWMDIEVL